MTPLEKNKRFWSPVIFIPLAVALIWVLAGVFSIVLGFDTLIDENFEGFDVEESICGTNGWGCPSGYSRASDVIVNSGVRSAYTSSNLTNDFVGGEVSSGEVSFYLYMPVGYAGGMVSIKDHSFDNIIYCYLEKANDNLVVWKHWKDGGWVSYGNLVAGTWNKLAFQFDRGTGKYNFSLNDSAWSEDFNMLVNDENIRRLQLEFAGAGEYFDDFGYTAPTEPRVWGIDPESETEITDLDTLLTIGYEAMEDYESLYITLKHPPTGIFTNAKEYDISEIGDSGELEINLQDFNIEKNSNWYLHAVATYEGYQYEGEYFLSGYGWNWTDDLTDGTYYLDINIEGYQEIFAMSDFETWYGENAKFDEPTAMFGAIASFFDPIFSVIGEFGNRINNYFNVNEAYGQGYEIGRNIAYFRYFIDEVSLFFGGFPILLWLGIIILILVGIFIFRLVLKFIPFLGGS